MLKITRYEANDSQFQKMRESISSQQRKFDYNELVRAINSTPVDAGFTFEYKTDKLGALAKQLSRRGLDRDIDVQLEGATVNDVETVVLTRLSDKAGAILAPTPRTGRKPKADAAAAVSGTGVKAASGGGETKAETKQATRKSA